MFNRFLWIRSAQLSYAKKVWSHRRVTLTESRPSGSIATGKRNQPRKFFSYIFMRTSLTAKRSIEISVLPGTVKSSVPVQNGVVSRESMQGNPDSRIKKFLLVESGILSFGTSRTIRIQNPNSTDKDWNLVQLYLESGIHGVESKIHDCVGASAWLSIGMSWVRFLRSDQLKYHVARNLLGF